MIYDNLFDEIHRSIAHWNDLLEHQRFIRTSQESSKCAKENFFPHKKNSKMSGASPRGVTTDKYFGSVAETLQTLESSFDEVSNLSRITNILSNSTTVVVTEAQQ